MGSSRSNLHRIYRKSWVESVESSPSISTHPSGQRSIPRFVVAILLRKCEKCTSDTSALAFATNASSRRSDRDSCHTHSVHSLAKISIARQIPKTTARFYFAHDVPLARVTVFELSRDHVIECCAGPCSCADNVYP